MNKTYRSVWNATTGTWMAAPETARVHAKSTSTVRSAVTAAVAMMAGVGGTAVPFEADAQSAANGAGGLALCGPTGGVNGMAYGSGGPYGSAFTQACAGGNNKLTQNHRPSFMLYNNTTPAGSGAGVASAATEAGIMGSSDGHLVLLGGSGVHITGPADFDNNVNMTSHRINNLAAGVAGTDAVNLNQLNAAVAAAGSDNPYVVTNTGTYAAATPAQAGSSATAIGANANASGLSAVALGGNTVASGVNGVAIGTLAQATGWETVAVGVGANAQGANSTAVGRGATSTAGSSVALGFGSRADRANSVSVGTSTAQRQITNLAAGTQNTDAVNLGQMNTALATKVDNAYVKVNSTAAAATAAGTESIAIGGGATAPSGASNQIAIGSSSNAQGTSATAIGSGASASGTGSASFGRLSNASGQFATALGNGTAALAGSATAIGDRSSVAAGATNSVALGSQASVAANVTNSVALGAGAAATRNNTVSVGSSTQQRQITNLAAGTQGTDAVNVTQLNDAIAGVSAGANPYFKANGANNGTDDALATGTGSIAIGSNAKGGMDGSVAIGDSAAASQDAVALGHGAKAENLNSISIGAQSSAADNAMSLGFNAKSSSNAMAIGANTVANGNNSVALGNGSVAAANNVISVGNTGSERRIVNLSAGTGATDAVNVGQLAGVTSALGGQAAVGADGSITQPTYNVGGTDYHNVGDALDALAASGGNPNAVTYDGQAKDSITLGGDPLTGTKITNVAAGDLSATSKDAVNGSQLFATNNRVGDLEDALTGSGLIDPVTGQSLAVTYDDASKSTITLGGDPATGTQIKNVANGVDANDAVNVSQLDALQASTGEQITTATRYFKANGLNDGTDDALATGTRAVAIGANANAVSGNSVALGVNASASGTSALALGTGASASAINSVALGANSVANQIGVVSVGQVGSERRIVNVGDAQSGTDAVNLRTLEEKIGAGSTATLNQVNDQVAEIKSTLNAMPQAAASSDYFVADGAGDGSDASTVAAGQGGLAAGADAVSSGIGGVAVGTAAKATGTQATALGTGAEALNGNATAIGGGAIANGSSSVAIGSGAVTAPGANFATAIGALASAAGGSAVAIGNGATAASQSLAIGTNSGATGANSVAMGFNAKATDKNSVALGVGSQTNRVNSVSVGVVGGERQITNVAAGTADTDAVNVKQLKDVGLVGIDPGTGDLTSLAVTYDDATKGTITLGGAPATGTKITNVAAGDVGTTSTDAINGAQLHGVSQSVADNLGGGASVNQDGTISAPTYDLADASGNGRTDYHNVGDALTNLDGRVTQNTGDIADLKDNLTGSGLIDPATGKPIAAVTYGTNPDGSANFDEVVLKGGANGTTLSNVAAGVADKDAVNVSQLKAAGLIDPTTGQPITAVTYDDASKSTITLGGDPATGTQIKNVANGADRHDAVNLGQLQDAGLVAPIDPTNPGAGLASLAVTYGTNPDGSANFDEVVLKGGANGTTLSNVAAGNLSATSKDAVNGSQLFATNTRVGDLEDSLSQGGVIDPTTGESLAVVYDSTAKNLVTLGNASTPVTLTNVAAGNEDTDAVNVSQLKAAGLIDPTTGQPITAVTYDDASKSTITLGGDPATGTQIKNVANGTDRHDAVNLGQLQDAGLVAPIDPTNPGAGLASLAVTYGTNPDGSANFDEVALKGGANGTTLSNVAAGVADKDAVNVSQLKAAGLIDPTTGQPITAVTYDDATKGTITLGGAPATGTKITNVAAGDVGTTSTDAINGAQLHGVSQSVADNLGGGASVNQDGTISAPTYDLADASGNGRTDYHNVGDALTNLDGRVTQNTGDIADLKDNLTGSGLIDPATGKPIAAVTYGTNPDGSANFDEVALKGGANGTTLSNVAAGNLSATSKDAVNGSQLFATNTRVGDLEDSLSQGGVIDPTTGESLAVVYDSTAKNLVTLGNASTPVTLTNVAAGNEDTDAVNVSQLKAAGLIDPTTGQPITAVTYDDASKSTITLGGDPATGTQIKNVANGVDANDAVNVSQLDALQASTGEQITTATRYFKANGLNDGTDDASATGSRAVAIGANANAVSGSSVALGANTLASGTSALALGTGASASAINSVALGANSIANQVGVVSVGQAGAERRIINVGDAQSGTDAVNLRTLDAKLTSNSTATLNQVNDQMAQIQSTLKAMPQTAASSDYFVADGAGDGSDASTVAAGQGGLAAGAGAISSGIGGVAVGTAAKATGTQATALGTGAQALNGNATAIGGGATANGSSSVAIGSGAVTAPGADFATAIGSLASAAGASAVAIGNGANAASQGLAIGTNAGATGTNATAMGYNAQASAGNSVALGANSQATRINSVSVGVMGGERQITNVAAGTAGTDAVNVDQLKDYVANNPGGPGNPLAVAYDDASKGTITLGGDPATGTKITNVAAGDVGAASTDAINGAQLHGVAQSVADNLGGGSSVNPDGTISAPAYDLADAAGNGRTDYHNVGDALTNLDGRVTGLKDTLTGSGLIDPVTGQSLAVTYDDVSKNAVTLGNGVDPVAVKNVANGADRHDAVNVGQLQDAGLVAPIDPANPGAGLKSLAVAYDDVSQESVTLAGANGTTLTNVKAGAVNGASTDAVNGAQLHGVSQSVADSLGGGSIVDANGNVTAPTYSLADPTDVSKPAIDYHDVGAALGNLDGRVVTNTNNITVIQNQLADSGLVDPTTGQSFAAVTYDNKNGATDYNSVTLGGGKATGPVALKNVADGVDAHDAVNVSQLQNAGLVAPVDPTNPGAGLTSLAVTYGKNTDGSANFDKIELKGANGTTITNVAEGDLSATSTDAVNGSQLFATNTRVGSLEDTLGKSGLFDPTTGDSLAVVYDSAAKDHVTLGGAGASNPVVLANVAQGVAGTDAVNVDQLSTAIRDVTAGANPLGVSYDTIAKNQVTLGGVGAAAPVVLTNVAAGTSTYDAVNYGQLSDLSDKFDDLGNRVGALETGNGGGGGGGSGDNPYFAGTGDASSAAANAGNGTGNTAAGSGATIGTGANNATVIGSGANATKDDGVAIGSGSKSGAEGAVAIGQGASATGSNSVALGAGSVASDDNTVSIGSLGNERTLSNVKDGFNASDAATKGQLDRAVGGLQGQINDVSKNAYSGIAAATALTMIPGVDPGKTLSFGVGGATYKGYQAVAFGGEARITQNLKMKAGVGLSSGGNTVGVGAAYQW
ncbi:MULTISPECIES: YadA-like family protein [Burkholderia]|uniref:YadA-like family protein n=1 Tax=Burkholderia TaxID=32008 RepID=UPI000427B3AB|nr:MULTISPECIES: YadA-like family protein [Burkholderia]